MRCLLIAMHAGDIRRSSSQATLQATRSHGSSTAKRCAALKMYGYHVLDMMKFRVELATKPGPNARAAAPQLSCRSMAANFCNPKKRCAWRTGKRTTATVAEEGGLRGEMRRGRVVRGAKGRPRKPVSTGP